MVSLGYAFNQEEVRKKNVERDPIETFGICAPGC